MSAQDLLLGFDAREAWVAFQAAWDTERRQTHLLRQDIEKPWSVDSDVWPSVFDVVPGLARPDWTGPVQAHWEDPVALVAALTAAPHLDLQQTRLIAVELVAASASEAEFLDWCERVVETAPPRLDRLERRLAGYDVADYYLTSALTNCGSPLWDGVEPCQWAPLLNQHHLFQDRHAALQFKQLADSRVTRHAPFFVFALWLLEPLSTVL